jgi:hypothetical protein
MGAWTVPHWLRSVRFHSRPRCMAWQVHASIEPASPPCGLDSLSARSGLSLHAAGSCVPPLLKRRHRPPARPPPCAAARCCVVLPLLPASARPTTKRLASIPRSFRRRQRCTALYCNTSPASAASISGTAPQKPSSPSRAKHAGPISLRLRQGARPRRGHRAAGSQDQHHV